MGLICTFVFFFAFTGLGQDKELKVIPKNNQTVQQQTQDESQCASYADEQTKAIKP